MEPRAMNFARTRRLARSRLAKMAVGTVAAGALVVSTSGVAFSNGDADGPPDELTGPGVVTWSAPEPGPGEEVRPGLVGTEVGEGGRGGSDGVVSNGFGESTFTGHDLAYHSVAPCRIVDTRFAGGRLQPGVRARFNADGTGSAFSNQGGDSSCSIPGQAIATELAFTAIGASASGFMRAGPSDTAGAYTGGTLLNFPGGVFNPTSSASVLHCDGASQVECGSFHGSNSGAPEIGFEANRSIHLVVEVVGYYTVRPFAVVSPSGNLQRGAAVSSVTDNGTGDHTVNFTGDVSDCSGTASTQPSDDVIAQVDLSGNNSYRVTTDGLDGNPNDQSFELHILC